MKCYRAYAKVNIFLKITGLRNDYHEIISRFVRVDSLYDELSFIAKDRENDTFEIVGTFSCDTKQNTIYKAYKALLEYLDKERSRSLKQLMRNYALHVKKNIPAFAGLGGGSSDAATFLKMCNEVLHLGLSQSELASIGMHVGADVVFFIYGYESANVGGIGEVVEKFDEDPPDIEIFTPAVEVSTPKVYALYREKFYDPVDARMIEKLKKTSSLDILKSMSADEANDLLKPALQEYKLLKEYKKEDYFFSGSGSSFFRAKERMI